jgi:hypothetical protein
LATDLSIEAERLVMHSLIALPDGQNISDAGWATFDRASRVTLVEGGGYVVSRLLLCRATDGRGLVVVEVDVPGGETKRFGEMVVGGQDWAPAMLRTAGRAGFPTVIELWLEKAANAATAPG